MNDTTTNIATRQTELHDELMTLVETHGSEELKKILSNNQKAVMEILKHSKTIIAAHIIKEYLKQNNGVATVQDIMCDLNINPQLVYAALKALDIRVSWHTKTHMENITVSDDIFPVASI